MPRKKNYPKTLPAAVDHCLKTLDVRTLEQVAELGPYDCTHFGLGMWIRNHLGLWGGNHELMEAIGAYHPDDASGPIVAALVKYLKKHKDWRARRRTLRARKTPPAMDAQ